MSAIPPDDEMHRFLDHAVHDLRSALRKIGTSAEILGEDRPSGDPAYLAILQGVARGTAILAGMSSYSTALATAHYSFTPVRVEIALNAALKRLEGQISEASAAVTRGPLPEIVGDKERLTDLFRILIANALTYRSAEPPKVDISARPDADGWVLSVRDNGIGIAPQYQERIFAPFCRLHGSEIPGVGLGLSTCRKILEAHGGRIWIESAQGVGATFLFTLPAERR